MVQRRAARFLTNGYGKKCSVSDKLNKLNWDSLESRRQKYQQQVDINSDIHLKKSTISPKSKHKQRFLPFSTTIDIFKTLIPRTIRLEQSANSCSRSSFATLFQEGIIQTKILNFITYLTFQSLIFFC